MGKLFLMQPFCFGGKHSRENRSCGISANKEKQVHILSLSLLRKYAFPWMNRWNTIANLNLCCHTKHREILHRASQNKIADSQFGLFCQLTPPSRSFNSLSSVIYKPKFGVVAGCLNSIFCLSFIQLLSTSKLTPCHQHRGITCPKRNKSGVARGWAQQARVHSTRLGKSPGLQPPYFSAHRSWKSHFHTLEPISIYSKIPTLAAVVKSVPTDSASQNSATAFYPA